MDFSYILKKPIFFIAGLWEHKLHILVGFRLDLETGVPLWLLQGHSMSQVEQELVLAGREDQVTA